MIEILLGAGVGWAVARVLGREQSRRESFPFVPAEFWTPRDKLFRVKEEAFVRLQQTDRLNQLYRDYALAHPDHAFGMLLLSLAASNEGRWGESLEHAKELVEAEPKLSVGWWRVAVAAGQLGDDALVAEAMEKFIKLEPDSRLVPHAQTHLTRLFNQGLAKSSAKRASKKAPAKKPDAEEEKKKRMEELKARARKVRDPLS
jgi:hypothetical protein